MFKQNIEGWSREGFEEALFDAMTRASEIMKGLRNAHARIKELSEPEEGLFHAVLEIETEIMGLHDDLNIVGQFKEISRAHDLHFRIMQKQEHEHLEHVIADHFARLGNTLHHAPIPDFILMSMGDVNIENNEIERNLHPRVPHNDPDPEPE